MVHTGRRKNGAAGVRADAVSLPAERPPTQADGDSNSMTWSGQQTVTDVPQAVLANSLGVRGCRQGNITIRPGDCEVFSRSRFLGVASPPVTSMAVTPPPPFRYTNQREGLQPTVTMSLYERCR